MLQKIYPFKFLDAYTKSDQSIFFGREEEIDKLFTACNNSNIILLYGASGVGKTSLVQCGLSKRLSRHSWVDIYIRRGQNINDSLQEVLARYESQEEEDLLSDVDVERSLLEQQIHNIYLEYFRPIYLIFDQFEELFVLGTEEEQEQFYATVAELLAMKQEVKLIFSVREEYLASLYPFEQRVEALMQHRIRVEPMSLSKIALVLKGINQLPGSLVSVKKGEEEALAELLCQQFQSKGNRLPLPYFQVILDKLYRQIGQEEAVLSVAEARKLPKMDDIMRAFLEERIGVIADRNETVQEQLWTMLLGMVSLEGTKIPMDRHALAQKVELNPSFVQEQLEALVSNRILRYREEDEVYELAHDSLALSVAEKRSGDEKELLSIKAYLQSVLQMEVALQEPLSENWLARIEPLLIKLRLSEVELAYVQESQRYIQEQRQAEIHRLKAEQEAEKQRLLREQEAEKRLLEAERRVLRARLVWISVALIGFVILCFYAFSASYERGLALEEKKKTLAEKNKVLNNIYFYKGRYGLTVKKDAAGQFIYGYMDRRGERKIPYRYTDARPFMQNGYARVKIGEALYLIDTLGNRYSLAESIDAITDSTQAVDLGEQLLTSIPQEVLENKDLEVLLMPGNKLDSLPEALKDMSSLKVVDLSFNNLEGSLPEVLGDLESLEQLDISANKLEKATFEEGYSKLRILDLSQNALDTVATKPEALDELEQLNLYDNELVSLGGLKGLNKLQRLNVSNNYLRQVTKEEIQELSRLKELDLYGNNIGDTTALKQMTSLGYLNLGNNTPRTKEVEVSTEDVDTIKEEPVVEVVEEEEKFKEKKSQANKSTENKENQAFSIDYSRYVKVEGGRYKMGCTSEQSDCKRDEFPVLEVEVSTFYISKYEVTFEEYSAYCAATGKKPPYAKEYGDSRPKHPVQNVSWESAVAYAKWLSEREGKKFRLPTEEEWEYAARGGNKTANYVYAGSNELKEVACYSKNSKVGTTEVGQRKPNELGIYDMSGNLWEWCSNEYHRYGEEATAAYAKYRIIRGGSWSHSANEARVAYRYYDRPKYSNDRIGFRLVYTP